MQRYIKPITMSTLCNSCPYDGDCNMCKKETDNFAQKGLNKAMRKTHEIKLNYEFQDAVLSGEKCFEVRLNDRGYQKGDLVKFNVNDRRNVVEPLDNKLFEITYVLSGWHIEEGYVVFGIKPIMENEK